MSLQFQELGLRLSLRLCLNLRLCLSPRLRLCPKVSPKHLVSGVSTSLVKFSWESAQVKVDFKDKASSMVREVLFALFGKEPFRTLNITARGQKEGSYGIPENVLLAVSAFVNRNVSKKQKFSAFIANVNKRAPEWRKLRTPQSKKNNSNPRKEVPQDEIAGVMAEMHSPSPLCSPVKISTVDASPKKATPKKATPKKTSPRKLTPQKLDAWGSHFIHQQNYQQPNHSYMYPQQNYSHSYPQHNTCTYPNYSYPCGSWEHQGWSVGYLGAESQPRAQAQPQVQAQPQAQPQTEFLELK
ncbi:hypothetical protein ONE63_011201 [Megalurothrips usitatus]|uniref:Uncharacterized protein n=1 Tax=Megalurothrips usitatus TaxID=439358 RepID=A0AAV7WZX8_9NEOP|nr:hypothetical protein ONE63_011201 [Megalurothrips usitatus]